MKQICLLFALLLPCCSKAQINESFDSTQISYRYAWKGDTAKFISGNGFLQLNDRERSSEASVSLYGATLNENEWIFRVKSDYRTSNNNYFRIYLWSNKENPADSPTAYYIELGNKIGIDDQAISLCYTEAQEKAKTLITKKIANLQDQFDIHIRVVTKENQMVLYAHSNTKTEFTEIGTADYTPLSSPGFFILYCNYSSKHAKDKYFGPVHIQNVSFELPEEPEEQTDSLALVSFKQENESTLLLQFNHSINPVSAVFSLIGLGRAEQITLSEDEKTVRLSWEEKMEHGIEYTLVGSDLYDKETDRFSVFVHTFQAAGDIETPKEEEDKTSSFHTGDLLINEIMADPKGAAGLPETEYIELFNATAKTIDLNNWIFCYADKNILLKDSIPSQGYAVLYRENRSIQVDDGGVKIPLDNFPSALANTGKQVSIKSPDSSVIDEYTYPKAKSGLSWERTNAGWTYSSNERGGTPGSANQTASSDPGDESEKTVPVSGEIIFSELLPEPQEGGSEYIELYNRSKRDLPLTDLSISIRTADGTLSTAYPLSTINETIKSENYALLTKNVEGVRNFFLISSPETLHEVKLPVLANTSSQLVLFRNQDEEVIDEVHYNSKWHAESTKNPKGIALERIHLQGESQDASNWTSASSLSGGGTPGYKNSQNRNESDETSTGITIPEYSDESKSYTISYHLDKAGYICKALIFDTGGRRICEIINHASLGTEGVISWDGLAKSGNKIPAGIYIFYAELYHPQGGSKIYKKVFLVR